MMSTIGAIVTKVVDLPSYLDSSITILKKILDLSKVVLNVLKIINEN